MTIDFTVSIPEGLVMRVVMLLAFPLRHGPVAGHGQSIRPHHRVEKGARHSLIMILAKKLAIDFDA